jgi:hypothetical protein
MHIAFDEKPHPGHMNGPTSLPQRWVVMVTFVVLHPNTVLCRRRQL